MKYLLSKSNSIEDILSYDIYEEDDVVSGVNISHKLASDVASFIASRNDLYAIYNKGYMLYLKGKLIDLTISGQLNNTLYLIPIQDEKE